MYTHLRVPTLLLATLLPLACTDGAEPGDTDTAGTTAPTGAADETAAPTGADDETGAPTTSGADGSTTDTTGTAPDFYACEEKMFAGAPLAGPGFDAAKGGIQGPLQDSYVLHATQIYLRAENAEQFLELAGKVSAEAMKTEGLIAFSVGADNGCGVARTIGIWANEEALYKLVTSEAHVNAMAKTTDLSYTGRTAHWTATAAEANAYTYDVSRARLEGVEPSPIY